tara:strand:- start:3499 stop:3720 length:222 start_codon:yes stop_codon:yes gene_type:complete
MVAVRLPQPRHCAPHPQKKFLAPKKGRHFFCFLRCLGVFDCHFHKNFSEKVNQEHRAKKKQKKEVKVSSRFKK